MDPYKNKYLKYKQKYLKKKIDLINKGINLNDINNLNGINNLKGGSNNNATLYLFKADWCGHCKNFKNKWDSLNNDPELNKKIKFIEYDSELHNNEIKNFNISGFPTLMLNVGDKKIEYNGVRDISNIKSFINSHV